MAIELVPDLVKYPQICGAHKDEKLIIFVGAGVSALWGCKRWKDMAVALIDSCYTRGSIDYWERENLTNKYSASPRKLITIAKNILGKYYLEDLKETLKIMPQRKDKLPNLFKNLFDLNAIYITTNIDNNLSVLFEENNIHFDPNKYTTSILKRKNIVHLHGVIDHEDSHVLTIDEYIARYRDKNHKEFLEHIFLSDEEKYCILFVGYGVDEMEIIDYLIEKYSDSMRRSINRLYVLLPFFQNEEQLLGYEKMYFDKISMAVIAYNINSRGYDQLNEVIETWQKGFVDYDLGKDFYKFNQIIERNL